MQNLTQRINLWVGLFLASLSTAATAYYLFQLMAAYPVLVQYTGAMAGTSLEVARYSLTLSRDKVLPAILFMVSVGCSWQAMNTAFDVQTSPDLSYLVEAMKEDRELALTKAEEYEKINFKEKADLQRQMAAQSLQRIEAIELHPGVHADTARYWVNQVLMLLIAVLIDVVSIRCLFLTTMQEPLSIPSEGKVVPEEDEAPLEEEVEPLDSYTPAAALLIHREELRNSKNAIKSHFNVGWDRACKIHKEVNECPE